MNIFMRIPEELNSPEFETDMSELKKLLEDGEFNFTFKRHHGAEPKVKELIGYYPAGEWHIVIDDKYSVIRGMASFGDYEIHGGGFEAERFETAQEVIDAIKKR